MKFERRLDENLASEVPEEVSSEVVTLNDKAISVGNFIKGREHAVAALRALGDELERVPAITWPEPEAVALRVNEALRRKSVQSYTTELRDSKLLNQVFPEGTHTVHFELVDDSLQVMRFRRFERLGGTAGSYSAIIQDAKHSAAEQLHQSAVGYQEPTTDQATITRCYREEVVSDTMTAIHNYAMVLADKIKPRHRTFAQFVTNKAVQYEESVDNGIVSANRQARRLTERLRRLNDHPEDYLVEQIIAYMSEKRDYALIGKNQARSEIMRIMAGTLRRLNIRLEEAISVGDSSAAEDIADEIFADVPTPDAELKLVLVREQPGPRQENGLNHETFSNMDKVPMDAAWLPKGYEADLYEYRDNHGNSLLAVRALNDKAQAVYEASHFTRSDETGLEKRWLQVLGKVLAARDSAGRAGFRGFRVKQGEMAQEYEGMSILYDGPRRQPNALRMYFASMPASQVIDSRILKSKGIDPDTQLVVQLGVCRKSTQLQMTSIFTRHSRASLREKGIGSQ